jgi:hypothetical protein
MREAAFSYPVSRWSVIGDIFAGLTLVLGGAVIAAFATLV